MSIVDHEGGAEFPYSKNDVFEALLSAIPTVKGMKVSNADKVSSHINVKVGVSLRSWGENMPISISEVSPGLTRVSIISSPKTGVLFGGALDLGKNRQNIEKIIEATSKILSSKPPATNKVPNTATLDPAQRLAKLKELLENGLIDKKEFESKKADVLKDM